ncbi:hypothetical protein [Fictibacillus gelatini]|uniref:hypothetical protein n=1 Tax=Fictibacillus gelatini TaxID=225985 RepID=UPI00040F8028|nr:hypothetical protein [Fictibacillus gelatini]
MKDSFVDSWNKEIVNGNAKSRAHWVGNVVVQVGLSFLGTKGADKVTKTLKLSKMPKVPNVLKAKRKGKITKAFNAVHPKLQSVFNVLSPAYIRQIVTKSYDDMLKATKTEMRKTLDAIGNIGFKVYAVTPEGHKIPVKVTLKDLWLKITSNINGDSKENSKRIKTKTVSNMKEFFETEFGKSIRDSLVKTKVQYERVWMSF